MKITTKNMFCISLFIYFFSYFWLIEANSDNLFSNYNDTLFSIFKLISYALLLVKFFLDFKSMGLNIFKSLLILLIAYISFKHSNSNFLTPVLIFIAFSKDIKCEDVVKTIFMALIFSVIPVILLSFLGIIDNTIIYKSHSGEIAYSLGFYHPNTTGAIIFEIVMLYLYLNYNKINLKKILLIMCIVIFSYYYTKSRTSALLIAFALMSLTIYKYLKKTISEKNAINLFSSITKYVFITITSVCLIISMTFEVSKVANLFTGRLGQMIYYYKYYGLTLWGQKLLGYLNNIDQLIKTKLYILDNGYMYLLLGFGIVMFTLFILYELKMITFAKKNMNFMLLIILLSYIIYGFSETVLIRWNYNFSLFLIGPMLFEFRNRK